MYVRRKFLNDVWVDDQVLGGERQARLPKAGEIIAFRDTDTLVARPWRVIDTAAVDDEMGGMRVRFRDPAADPDPLSGQGEEWTGRWGGKKKPKPDGEPPAFTDVHTRRGAVVLPEDYPVGILSGELLPTADKLWAQVNKARQEEHDRFSMTGFCPACGQPITERQHHQMFDTNLMVPGGPPVTFHVRKTCWDIGGKYQAELKRIERGIAADLHNLDLTSWIEGDIP